MRQALSAMRLHLFDQEVGRFFGALAELQTAQPDVLDLSSPYLSRNIAKFRSAVSGVESEMGAALRRRIMLMRSAEESMALLGSLRTALPLGLQESLMDQSSRTVFSMYHADLQKVLRRYTKRAKAPPLPRNFPQAAGHVAWARQLRESVESPMRAMCKEAGTRSLLARSGGGAGQEVQDVVATYTRLTSVLKQYEKLWYTGWCRAVDAAQQGLKATLIVRHPEDGGLYVNFDPSLLLLVRECGCFHRMGHTLPSNARQIWLQGPALTGLRERVGLVLSTYAELIAAQPAIAEVAALLAPGWGEVEASLSAGMSTVCWCSLFADSWVTAVLAQLDALRARLSRTHTRMDSIAAQLKHVGAALLVHLPTDPEGAAAALAEADDATAALTVVTVDGWITAQEKLSGSQSEWLQAQNIEIEEAVEELLGEACLDGNPTPEAAEGVKRFYRGRMYRAVLGAVTSSLAALKERFSAASYGFLFVDRPFFDVDVELAIPSVRMTPDLDSVQLSVNRVARSVLSTSLALSDWSGTGDEWAASTDECSCFHAKLARDRQVMLTVLGLAGAVAHVRAKTEEYVGSLSVYDYLWQEDAGEAVSAFLDGSPSLLDVEDKLRQFCDVEAELRQLAPVHNIGPLSIETAMLKHSLLTFAGVWKAAFARQSQREAEDIVERLEAHCALCESQLGVSPKRIEDVRTIMATVKLIRDTEADWMAGLSQVEEIYSVLEKHQVPLSKGEGALISREAGAAALRERTKALQGLCSATTQSMHAVQQKFRATVLASGRRLKVACISFRSDWESSGPGATALSPEDSFNRLRVLEGQFKRLDSRADDLRSDERLFGIHPLSSFSELSETARELRLFRRVVPLRARVSGTRAEMARMPWSEAKQSLPALKQRCSEYNLLVMPLRKHATVIPAMKALMQDLDEMKACLAVASKLCNAYIRWRHWAQVQPLLTLSAIPTAESGNTTVFLLGEMLGPHVAAAMSKIEVLCFAAEMEYSHDIGMQKISEEWAEKSFEFAEYRDRGSLTFEPESTAQLLAEVDETQIQLGLLLQSRYVGDIRHEVLGWMDKMLAVQTITEKFLRTQTLWMQLESIFSGSDVESGGNSEHMSRLSSLFNGADRQYETLMSRARQDSTALRCCLQPDGLEEALDHLIEQLQRCKRGTSQFVDLKRGGFARFFFLTDNAVLEVLSTCDRQPATIGKYLDKMFDNIAALEFDEDPSRGGLEATAMRSMAGEILTFGGVVPCRQKPVECWLRAAEIEMRHSMESTIAMTRASAHSCASAPEMLVSCTTQLALVVSGIRWTEQVEACFRSARRDPHALRALCRALKNELDAFVAHLAQVEADECGRARIEALITAALQQYEVCCTMDSGELQDIDAYHFEWLRHCRLYCDQQSERHWTTTVRIGQASFEYGCEFLGTQHRSVATPLRDRCYLSLAAALEGMRGGALVGPPGCGKADTVRGLAQALGVFVLSFRCTADAEPGYGAAILKGVAQSGVWVCLEQFVSARPPTC